MPAATSDLSSLAALAWDPHLDVRHALLRVQAGLFAGAPVRDAEAVASFESLALGLLPGVDDATALAVARILAPVEDTPGSVIRFLVARGGAVARATIAEARRLPEGFLPATLARNPDWADAVASRRDLSPADIAALLARAEPAIDLALARNPAVPLDGSALACVVERARSRPDLAGAILARGDLPLDSRAALYLAAPPPERDAIRAAIAGAPALRASPLPRASREAIDALVADAAAQDRAGFEARLHALLGLAPPAPALDLAGPERHDLLALALAAAGVGETEAITVFLTLDDGIARSVATVFRLAALVRETPRSCAIRLVEAILDRPLDLRRAGRHQPLHDPSAAERARAGAARRERPDMAALRAASGRAG